MVLDSPLDKNGKLRGVLLSIHLTSNRPDKLVRFFDRLEDSTEDMRAVEVAIKIEDTDEEMNALLEREVERRPFRITYISTPLEGGFYGLWTAYDDLLKVCDPHAYFVVGVNDEMYFTEKGWDQRLKKYVNLYPDHIYRLRTSIHRERNYFDYWEGSCAGDLSAIMTKRWIELGGGWCPCTGPDSFQNTVAFYFGWLYRHETFNRPYRERVVHDIEFEGFGANLDLDGEAQRRRTRGGVIAWFKLVSYPVQQEAARHAQKLHAHIWAIKNGPSEYELRDDDRKHFIHVIDRTNGLPVWRASYKLSKLRIAVINFVRKFNYPYYGGAGEPVRYQKWNNTKYFFLIRYEWLDKLNASRILARCDAREPKVNLFRAIRNRFPDLSGGQRLIYFSTYPLAKASGLFGSRDADS